jgi:hypothetical protein
VPVRHPPNRPTAPTRPSMRSGARVARARVRRVPCVYLTPGRGVAIGPRSNRFSTRSRQLRTKRPTWCVAWRAMAAVRARWRRPQRKAASKREREREQEQARR